MVKKNQVLALFIFLISIAGVLQLFSDGFIIIRKNHSIPHFRPFPMAVKYHHVNVAVSDNFSETKIDQVFFNPSRRRLEGDYIFPVPRGAVIKKFSMYINGKETSAELLNAKKAKKIYEEIVRKMKDPALLEYRGRDVFRVRIFPIEPMSEKRIKISYTQVLNREGKTVEYIYPLNTERFSSSLIGDVSVKVDIKSSQDLGNIYCPTHKTEIIRKGRRRAFIGFEASNVRPDRDFKIYFDSGNKEMNFSLKTFGNGVDNGFFFLNITPPFGKTGNEIIPKEVVFVLDVSGSMAGKKLEQAKKALKFCVNNLRNKDRFNIIRFSTEAESLFEISELASKERVARAMEFIDDLRAIGGTNISEALEMSLKGRGKDVPPRTIIFITDGKPTVGETDEDKLIADFRKRNREGSSVLTFGIGNDINTHLLDRLTSITGSFRSYIAPDEDIEVKISDFFRKIESPVLRYLTLKVEPPVHVKMIYPKQIPNLYLGSSVTLIGRFSGSGKAKIVLTGRMMRRKKSFVFHGNFKSKGSSNDYIPGLWAARRVGYLLDQIRLNGESRELKREVIRIARKYGIITPYTSYLIVDDERRAVSRREIGEEQQLLAPSVVSGSEYFQNKKRYRNMMKAKSGRFSIMASKEVQSMNHASDYSQIAPGTGRIPFRGTGKNGVVFGNVVKNIMGRAFYYRDNEWVDSLIRINHRLGKVRIAFLSDAYFKLLEEYPETALFLSLGNNVKFIFKGKFYEIYESK